MNRRQIQDAIARRLPFSLKMADGQVYQVPNHDYIALPPATTGAFVIVFDDNGHTHYLPLITMTGLSYLDPDRKPSNED
jgi:hypothetical protein